jgi:hypothetical protein
MNEFTTEGTEIKPMTTQSNSVLSVYSVVK